MIEEWLYQGALCAAFWVALFRFRAASPRGAHAARFVLGIALGALAAGLGGLLWVPGGLLLVTPWRSDERDLFLEAALPALPLAFAVAKLGCLAAGCCTAALVEALAFAAVGLGLARLPPHLRASAALAGIGAVRLAVLPLRPGAELSGGLAVLWLFTAALRCPSLRETACPPPGNATSKRTARSSRAGCAGSSAARATWS
ncbi:MAG: hypothetical protein ACREI8_06305 [Myxococcota bacterium]